MKSLTIELNESGLPQYEPPEYRFVWHGEMITKDYRSRLLFLAGAMTELVEQSLLAYPLKPERIDE